MSRIKYCKRRKVWVCGKLFTKMSYHFFGIGRRKDVQYKTKY